FGFDDLVPALSELTRAGRDAAVDRPADALQAAERKLLSLDRSLLEKVDDARRQLIRQADDEKARVVELKERLRLDSSGAGAAHLGGPTRHLCRQLREAGVD